VVVATHAAYLGLTPPFIVGLSPLIVNVGAGVKKGVKARAKGRCAGLIGPVTDLDYDTDMYSPYSIAANLI
jgi:hypothetical protein